MLAIIVTAERAEPRAWRLRFGPAALLRVNYAPEAACVGCVQGYARENL